MRRILFAMVLLCLVALAVGCARPACAQTPDASAPDGSVGAALRNLASRAGAVFVGRVTAVTQSDGVVELSFAVELPVMGVTGATYTLREWAGLCSQSRVCNIVLTRIVCQQIFRFCFIVMFLII